MDLQRQVDSAKDALAQELGVEAQKLYPQIRDLEKRAALDPNSPASIKAQATLDNLQKGRDKLDAARSRLDQWTAKVAKEETPAAADKAPPKPDLANVKGGVPAGSSVGSYVAGRGWEVKDTSGKVFAYVVK